MANWSRTWTFFEGKWHEGNVPIMGARSHGAWLASTVFDGARIFEGTAPDLDLHCARVNRSAKTLGLNPVMTPEAMIALTKDGMRKFGGDHALYVKPMYWGEGEGPSTILPDPDDVGFALCLFEAPMPVPGGLSVTSTRFRRPTPESMPTEAKGGCLYPSNARALKDAKSKGFDNALVCDALGNVAETATANVFMAKDGVVKTPATNGTFLNGITRQRVIKLLRDDGVEVQETRLTYEDFQAADEIFTSGNYAKVMPVLKIDDRMLQPGPFYTRARSLYWAYAHQTGGIA
ncbi:MAG: branched-chain amino acid aminotransferase [Beijerinckiaceae bacterium]